jgi:hypothetical protein
MLNIPRVALTEIGIVSVSTVSVVHISS